MSHALCPEHQTPLSGGPVLYTCSNDSGHSVRAADIDHEFHAPSQPVKRAARTAAIAVSAAVLFTVASCQQTTLASSPAPRHGPSRHVHGTVVGSTEANGMHRLIVTRAGKTYVLLVTPQAARRCHYRDPYPACANRSHR